MSKLSAVKFRMPAIWVAAIAVLTVAIAGSGALFLGFRAQDAHAMSLGANKSQAPVMSAEQRGRVRASLDALPLAFEANQGQSDPQVKYTARGNGYSVFLTASDAVFAISSAKQPSAQPSRAVSAPSRQQMTEKIESAAIEMRLVGGNLKPEVVASNELPGVVNYYVGSDPKNWHTGLKQYSSVSYLDVYPGLDMVFHGAQRQLEFDFVVSPGADPKAIALGFKGARKLDTDASGNLVLTSSAGDLVLHKPVAYQERGGKREIVEAAFQVKNRNEVALNLGAYDRGRELVIDPSLTYATYLGGLAEDDAFGIAIDSSGNAYVTGQTKSTDFPTVTGSYSTSNKGGFDVFVTKIAADGASQIYSTYIGGTGDDSGNAIAVDGSGDAFVAGGTKSSTDFPTHNGFQNTFGGGNVDGFVLELAPSGGTLVFSTYLGGTGDDVANGIAVDTTGVYAVGFTQSSDFPLSGSPLQGSFSGTSAAFVTKLQSGGNALAYSTYLGGGTNDFASSVAVAGGNAYVTGATTDASFPVTASSAFQSTCGTAANCNGGLQDAFVSVIDSSGATLVYSTFFGGEANDQGLAIAVDASADAYVTGLTESSQFPVKSAAQSTFGGGTQDAFVAEFNPSGSPAANTLVYSTFLGGSQDDAGNGVAVDGSKNAYVVGQTNSSNFRTAAPTQSALGGGVDGFVSEISASGSLVFSTYLGGTLDENTNAGNPLNPVGAIAVDSAGANIYVAGNTTSSAFPTVNPLQPVYGGVTDAYVAKYSTGTSSNANFTVTNGALSNTSGHAGVSATATITVGSTNGFNSAVQLQCSVSPVVTKGPTCTIDPSVTPPANGTTTATLNVATTAASAMLTHPGDGRGSGFFYALILPVFGLTLLGAGVGPSGPRRRKFLGLVITGMVVMCLLLLPACGGSGGGGGGGGTPAGAYTITVTGTNNSAVVTGTPALTLTIN